MGKTQRSMLWAQTFLVLLFSISISISIQAPTPPTTPHLDTNSSIATSITQPQQNGQRPIPNNIDDNNHCHDRKQHIPDSVFTAVSLQPPPTTTIPRLETSPTKPQLSLDFLKPSQRNEETFEKSQLQTRVLATVDYPSHQTQPVGPLVSSSRPAKKPSLLTDYEYEYMWDPQPNTIRFGVLLPLNAIDHYLEASTVRRTLSVKLYH